MGSDNGRISGIPRALKQIITVAEAISKNSRREGNRNRREIHDGQ